MSKKFVFSSEEDEILIDFVQKNRTLYDCSHPKNKDVFFKDSLWNGLSEKINRTVEDCKKRWKNIRDTYMKQRKKLPTGSANLGKKKWPLMPFLSFLNSVEYERSSITNIETSEVEQQNVSNTEDNQSFDGSKCSNNDESEGISEDTHREKEDDLTRHELTVPPGGKKRSNNEKISDIIAKS